MKRTALALTLVLAASAAVQAGNARWLRNTAISPDGSTIAFTYQGNIYTVSSKGGNATPLTTYTSYNTAPVWSPDGKTIAFQSTREGGSDIYTVPATGGTPVRVTTASGTETPLAFVNDSTLLFTTSMMPSVKMTQPFMPQTYTVNVRRPHARPQMYLSIPMKQASVNAAGDLLYSDKKGYENVWRKHERSSGTSDIWLRRGGKFTKLTDFNGHDLEPVWKSDGSGFYYVSEKDGTLNVWEASADGKQARQLTSFKSHPVRSLSASKNGTLAFSWDGDIYTLSQGGQPQKLDVNITGDLYDRDRVKDKKMSGASYAVPSPSGEEVAFVIRGDIYVTDTKYETTKRITDTPAQERNVAWSPDGKTLVYDSDRDGYWQLFTAKVKEPKGERFAYATEITETPLYKCATSAQQPLFSPDGKKVAFLEGRDEIRVIDVETKKVNTALDGKYNYSYSDGDISFEWSPDSRWLLADFFLNGGWNNKDIALVRADGSEVVDLTESGYSDGNAKWVLGGKGIAYESGRYGMKSHGSWGNQSDVILMVLDQEAWDDFNMTEEEAAIKEKKDKDKKDGDDKKDKDGKKDKKAKDDKKGKKGDKEAKKDDVKPLEFDLANRHYRTRRLTPNSSMIADYYLSPKGDKLYYTTNAPEGGGNLMVRNLKKGDTKVLVKGVYSGMTPDAKGENLFVYSRGGIKKVKLPGGDTEVVDYKADYDRQPSLEREYIYDHAVRQVNDKFYDKNLHGVDWDAYGSHYREFLPYINNNTDFSIMLSELLGELNASHTGSGFRGNYADFATATLGAFYDDSYDGDGLMIEEVLPRSPLAAKAVNARKGDVILSIDGEAIKSGEDYYPMLEGKAGEKVRLEIKRPGGKTDVVVVKPISSGTESGMLYQRWIERNEKFVDSISGGKIGYVHVEGMDNPSFQTVYDRLLGKYRNCDAVVVDTRYNGGGWLHNDLAVLLNGKEYVKFMPRGKYIGSEPWAQWYKPSVMLVNESNYSDAHGAPYAYQTLGIGDIVGAPIPGTMTAVWWETQIDPTLYFGIPQVANCGLDGKPLENQQLNPDVLIYNAPEEELNGYDAQLAKAVEVLLQKTRK